MRRVQRIPETERQTGLCDQSLRRLEAAGHLTKRHKLAPDSGAFGAVGHFSDDIAEFVEARGKAGKVEAEAASVKAKAILAARRAKSAA